MLPLKSLRKQYGPLITHVVDGGPQPSSLLVLCHGYGAPGNDLVPLAVPLLRAIQERAAEWRCIFPIAPNSLAELGMPDGRAWWQINMQALMALNASNSWNMVRDKEPPGIEIARQNLVECITAACAEMQGENTRVVLGGFSQGAMLSMDVATRGLPKAPCGLILFSGTLVCESSWKAGAVQRFKGLPVLQSHGTWDTILPFEAAGELAKMLGESGADLRFIPFEGDHTIPNEAMIGAAKLLNEVSQSNPR